MAELSVHEDLAARRPTADVARARSTERRLPQHPDPRIRREHGERGAIGLRDRRALLDDDDLERLLTALREHRPQQLVQRRDPIVGANDDREPRLEHDAATYTAGHDRGPVAAAGRPVTDVTGPDGDAPAAVQGSKARATAALMARAPERLTWLSSL